MPEQTERDLVDRLERAEQVADRGERGAVRMLPSLRLVWRNRRLIFKVTAWGTLFSLALAFVLPTRYDSTARLMPADSQSSSNLAMLAALAGRGTAGAGVGAFAGDLLGLKTSGALYIGVLRSRTVQDRLIEKFSLKEVYWKSYDEDAREKLTERSSISEDRKSGIVTITVTDASAQRAADMANAYVDELNRIITQVSTSAARRERAFIEQRLVSVKRDLDMAAKELSQFASQNTAIDIQEQGRAMVGAAATLQGQLIAAESELQALRQTYAGANVRVRSVQARIAELRRQLQMLGGSTEAEGGAPLVGRSGPTRSAGLDPSGSDGHPSYPAIRDLPRLGLTYADLYRRAKIHETVFELLTQQFELAKVQEAKEIPTIKLLDAPVVPRKKSYPPRLLIIGLVATLSLGMACLIVIAKSTWANMTPSDPRRVLADEVVGSVQSDLRIAIEKIRYSRQG